MKKLLNKLKLIHKVNLVFYLAVLLVGSLIITFALTSSFIIKNLEKNYGDYKEVNKYESLINKNLKLLDHLTIENSLSKNSGYSENSETIYLEILKNLDLLKQHEFFYGNDNSIKTMQKIKKRLIGYKDITDSLEDEVQESFEDGMYAILALTTTSNIIFNELSTLDEQIESISKRNTEVLTTLIESRRVWIISLVISIFILMFYINNRVVKSILLQLKLLENGINSFLNFYLKSVKMFYICLMNQMTKYLKLVN